MKQFKKLFLTLIIITSALFLLSSCEGIGGGPKPSEFDVTLLPGTWKSGTVFEKYTSDGKGATWDTSEDVSEDEAQIFTWELKVDNLTQIHIMQLGAKVPRVYKVLELSATVLKYKDEASAKVYTFGKVK